MKTLRILKITLLWVCLIGLSIGSFWIGGRFFEIRNAQKDSWSQGRFAQLEVALRIYHDEHGAFPPTKHQPEPDGPIHSWRVLLVPSTSRDLESYSDYDFSQEWNSPNNLEALGHVQSGYFRMYADDGDVANYLAIGKDDKWPSKKLLKSRLVTEGTNRFLLVEDPDSKIHWMEPKY